MGKLILFGAVIYFLLVVISDITETRIQDIINPKKWKSVLVSLLKKFLIWLDGSAAYLEPHEVEQYMFRLMMCQPCVEKGKCTNCGCSTVAKMNVRKEQCSLGRWPKFKNLKAWNAFKEQNKVEFKLNIQDTDAKDFEV